MNPLVLDREPGAIIDNPVIPDELKQRLSRVCEAIVIESKTRFRFSDLDPIETQNTTAISNGVQTGMAVPQSQSSAAPAQMIASLSSLIYHYAYTQNFDGSTAHQPSMLAGQPDGTPVKLVDDEFLNQLRSANHSRPRWDPKWRVYQMESDGSVHVEKDGSNRLVRAGEYAFSGAASHRVSVGDYVNLRVMNDSTGDQPGFYFVFGESVPSDHDDTLLARFYFHVIPEHMPELLSVIGNDMNRLRIPFRLKCLTNPDLYGRSDPAVLYVAKRYLTATMRILANHREAIEKMTRNETPLFSKRVMQGVGAADEPGDGQSFGQHRCNLVCKGILDAWLRGATSTDSRLAAIDARFRANGLSLMHPHLNEGVQDQYHLPNEELN